jgi:release factor glutamine methyltransferase
MTDVNRRLEVKQRSAITRENTTTVRDALRAGRAHLASTGAETPGLDAEVLLRHVLGVERAALFARLADPIPSDTLAQYHALLDQRAGGSPVAYLVGEREFFALPFAVAPGVLIPRPETEILAAWAIDWLSERGGATVVDVGTGSGAIALSVAHALGNQWPGRIVAADVSPNALAVATRNRERFGLGDRVPLVRGSLVDWLGGPVDLLLANLPYLRPGQIDSNPELAAEPRLALDGGDDGLALIRRLLRDAPRVLRAGGAMGVEIDPSQARTVTDLARGAFPEAEITLLRDLAAHPRHVTIRRPRHYRSVRNVCHSER